MNKRDEEPDPKERILFAAIEEFGRHGYDAASTNSIVSLAGVSKGLLFHYYGNKDRLYLECAAYVMKQLEGYILQRLDYDSDDLFDRIKHSLRIKMMFCTEHPAYMGLAYKMWYSGEIMHIEEIMRKYIDKIPDYHSTILFKGADLSKLRDNMDTRKVMRYIGILLDTCWDNFTEQHDNDPYLISQNTDGYIAEAEFVLDMVKSGVYTNLCST